MTTYDDGESALLHRSLAETPYTVTGGSESFLTLQNGRKILDGCGGAAVAVIGHGNIDINRAAMAQMRQVSYVHTLTYTTKAAEDLAKFILDDHNTSFHHGLEKAFFVNSGSEANESAMKLGRQYFFEQGQTERKYYVSRKQAYHGNTIGAMSISTNLGRKYPYDGATTLPNVSHVSPAYAYQYKLAAESEDQYCDRLIAEIETEFQRIGPQKVIAFVAETVVGATAGCVFAPKGYFSAIRKICEKYGILLVLDEVMCGTGRTGTFFAFEQENVVPDMVTIGKGLGGGYAPISAVLIHKKIVDVLRRGTSTFNHGHTYQAHPVLCATALAVQRIIRREQLIARCQAMGEILASLLLDAFSTCKYVGDIRGRGLFWAIEFVKNKDDRSTFDPSIKFGTRVQHGAFELGVALYPGSGTVDGVNGDHILIAPPYTIKETELKTIVKVLKEAYDLQEKFIDTVV